MEKVGNISEIARPDVNLGLDVSRNFIDLNKLPPDLWRPFECRGGKSAVRVNERELSFLSFRLRSKKYPEWTPARLWGFSSLELELVYSSACGKLISANKGEIFDLLIQTWDGIVYPALGEVIYTEPYEQGFRLGIRRLDILPDLSSPENHPDRLSLTNDRFTATMTNPFLYNERCRLTTVSLYPKMGFGFRCEDPSLLLFNEMNVDIQFDLPSKHSTAFSGKICVLKKDNFGNLLFILESQDISSELSNIIGEYILDSESLSPARLGKFGFFLKRFGEKLEFSYAETMDDYAAVLALRQNAYIHAGKKDPNCTVESLATPLDSKSQIICAYHHKNLVGCATLTFPDREEIILRSEELFPGQKYPVKVPPKKRMIEAFALATHLHYRGGDLVRKVLIQCVKTILLSDRHWMITMCTESLWPLYKGIGFVKMRASCRRDDIGGQVHHLILAHRNAFLFGRNMSIIRWNLLFSEMIEELMEKGMLRPSLPQRLYLRFLVAFRPLARGVESLRLAREYRRANPKKEK